VVEMAIRQLEEEVDGLEGEDLARQMARHLVGELMPQPMVNGSHLPLEKVHS